MQRFDGEICGFGTVSGIRVVIGRWVSSPFGEFADAMVEEPDGHRWLIAPGAALVEYIGAVYEFDDTIVADVVTTRTADALHFAGGPLQADVSLGNRDALGWILRCVPRRIATSVAWGSLIDPFARVALHGVRTSGRTPGGRETYGATDRHRLAAATATWHGRPLGEMVDVDPPVRFGFSSTPTRPSIGAVTTKVRPLRPTHAPIDA